MAAVSKDDRGKAMKTRFCIVSILVWAHPGHASFRAREKRRRRTAAANLRTPGTIPRVLLNS